MHENLYLAHHGIKGQKWGRRRWQRPDGSLTPEGYRHYYGDNPNARMTRLGVVDSKTGKMLYQNPTRAQRKQNKAEYRSQIESHYGVDKAKKAYNDALSAQKDAYKNGKWEEYTKADHDVRFKKRELSDTKAYASFKEQASVSKRQEKLIESYKKQGFTQKEAEIAAYKRDRAEKIALAVAGTAAVAVTAYAAYKYADYAIDKNIKTKDVLYRVAQNSDKGVHDAFYAVFDKSNHDKRAYNGLYAQQLKRGDYGKIVPHVYEKKIGVNSEIKMASRKHAKELVAKELLRGDNFDKIVSEFKDARIYDSPLSKDFEKLKKTGKISNRLYDVMNQSLVNRDTESTKLFYKALRDAGYGAVKDVNDSKYSGFGTKLPVIVFESSKVSVNQVNELKNSYINKQARAWTNEYYAKTLLKSIPTSFGVPVAAASLAGGATAYAANKSEAKVVEQYRQEHPKSKLSRNEILKNYYDNQ